MKKEILRIDNGQVKIKGDSILNNLYLQAFAGETLGIIFHKLEEKNALMNLLSGDEKLSFGRLYLNEEMVKGNTENPIRNNIFTISESTKLISNFKIYENIFFTAFNNTFIESNKYNQMTVEVFNNFNIDIPVNKPVKELSNLERVTIELIKAYTLGSKLIVLSNITSIINSVELNDFFHLISQLKQKGLAFIVIETFEDIIFEQTNNICVIKNGKTIGVFSSIDLDKEKIYKLLRNEPLSADAENIHSINNQYVNTNEVVLSFKNVSYNILQNIDFDLRRGEILKIIYMDDVSVNELIGLLKGKHHNYHGRIFLGYKSYIVNDMQDAQIKGVCFIEENPTEVMLFKKLSVLYNLCIPLSNKVSWFWFRKKYSKSVIKSLNGLIEKYYFKKLICDVPPSILQKVVYCRWLLYSPKVVVCIKPFSITDVKVNQVTEQMINLLADKGIAILIVTSNWPSLSSIKGRILYLENGRLSKL